MATEHKQAKDSLTATEKSGSDYANSPSPKSMDFINETKFVMLNFMRLVPLEMQAGHIVNSPQLSNNHGNTFMSSIDDSSSFMNDDERVVCSRFFSGRNINSQDYVDLYQSVDRMPLISSMPVMECSDQIDTICNLDYYDEADAIDYVCGASGDIFINGNQQDTPDVGISNADGPRKLADRAKLQQNIQSKELKLDDVLLTLQTELNCEMEEESENKVKRFPGSSPVHTPQIDAAAHFIAHLGDEINELFGAHIAAAVSQLTVHPIENLTYLQFRQVAKTVVVSNLLGWRQVALYMVFGKKVIYGAFEQGHKQIGTILDYLSQLVADEAADFIIREGGWGSVMNIDPSQCSDEGLSDFTEYLSKYNVTKVNNSSMECKVQTVKSPKSANPSTENGNGEIRNKIDCHSGNKVGVFHSSDQTENVNGKFEKINAQSRIKTVARGTRSEHLWNILIQIRKMGTSVFTVTLAVLALGIGARLAVRSRK